MKWFEFDDTIGLWKCLHCAFTSKYKYGLQSHIRVHKNKHKQFKLSEIYINEDLESMEVFNFEGQNGREGWG